MTDYIEQVRHDNPVVLTVANMVTPGDVANAVNAIGGSPIMSSSPAEAEEMVNIAAGVTINAGTLNEAQQEEIEAVLKATDQTEKPVVLDPVAVALPYRHHFIKQVLANHRISLIRGNAGEIASLAGLQWESRGVDSGQGDAQQLRKIAVTCSKKYHTLVVLTGVHDVIADGYRVATNDCGTPMFQAYVGCGDMVSSVLAAFLATGGDYWRSALTGVQAFTVAGQLAAASLAQPVPGSFFTALLDQLYLLDDQKLSDCVKKESAQND
ncbi:hydroxyethylthiazole kinase [Limosilactobacillus sp.]|uniref:hydroxyethylthiazole kinase n=1 Tax=Limosilactobacillus sp. TaxID=2773925 RepID=UPI00345E0865